VPSVPRPKRRTPRTGDHAPQPGQLYGVAAHDPVTIIAAVLAIGAIAALAGYAPGRRATRIQPMEALRCE